MKHIFAKVFLIDFGYISTELMEIPSNPMIRTSSGNHRSSLKFDFPRMIPVNPKQKSYSSRNNAFPLIFSRSCQVPGGGRDNHPSQYNMPSSCKSVPVCPRLLQVLPAHCSKPVQIAEPDPHFGNAAGHPSLPGRL